MRRRVVILGAGMSGLIVAWIFRRVPNVEIVLLEESRRVGGELLGLPRVIERSNELAHILAMTKTPYSNCSLSLGVLLRGAAHAYPACLKKMSVEQNAAVRAAIWRKAHLMWPDSWNRRQLVDHSVDACSRVLRFDVPDFVRAIVSGLDVRHAKFSRVEGSAVVDDVGCRYPFDYLVTTIPMWELCGKVPWFVPEVSALRSNLALIQVRTDRWTRWDVLHTPYTPEGSVRCIVPHAGGYACEAVGELDRKRLVGDLNFLFPDGFCMERIATVKGTMVPSTETPQWPPNVSPVGRYAEWSQHSTPGSVARCALALGRKWFGDWWNAND